MDKPISLPRFEVLNEPATMNGPITEGYACKFRVFIGEGVVGGADVMIVAPTPEIAEAVAAFVEDVASTGNFFQMIPKPAHVLLAQMPWYKSKTKGFGIEEIVNQIPEAKEDGPFFSDARRRRRSLLD